MRPESEFSTSRSGRAREAVWDRAPQTSFRIVDAHAHLGRDAVMFMPRSEGQDLIGVMDRCGVATAVASSMLAIRQSASRGNDVTCAVVDALPGRYVGAMVLNPWQSLTEELNRWRGDPRMRVIKIHPDVHEYPLSGERFEPLWSFAEETGCPVLSHTDDRSKLDNWAEVAEVCRRHPELHLVAGHSGVTPAGLDIAIHLAQKFHRLFLELSGSASHGRCIERLVGSVGADQVLYGSDFPFIDMRTGLGRLLFADINDDARAKVLGTTMERLLGWREM